MSIQIKGSDLILLYSIRAPAKTFHWSNSMGIDVLQYVSVSLSLSCVIIVVTDFCHTGANNASGRRCNTTNIKKI
jgi:hypothetical protein